MGVVVGGVFIWMLIENKIFIIGEIETGDEARFELIGRC